MSRFSGITPGDTTEGPLHSYLTSTSSCGQITLKLLKATFVRLTPLADRAVAATQHIQLAACISVQLDTTIAIAFSPETRWVHHGCPCARSLHSRHLLQVDCHGSRDRRRPEPRRDGSSRCQYGRKRSHSEALRCELHLRKRPTSVKLAQGIRLHYQESRQALRFVYGLRAPLRSSALDDHPRVVGRSLK